MKVEVTTPESSKYNTVKMKASPAFLDSGIVPSVDASTQQASTSMAIEVAHTTALPASSAADKKPSEDKMKVTMPESSKDNTVQMKASPAVFDSNIVPSVDA
eukprot:6761703-Ditylum_brightwellii.AAC.1